MKTETPPTILRLDYKPTDYLIDSVDLRFDLDESHTHVLARSQITRREGVSAVPLRLHGRCMELLRVAIDGQDLNASQYQVDDESLQIDKVPQRFTLEVETRIQPQDNKSLEGLYKSSGNFCTQCEAEGFRKITYFYDRPDVLATFHVTILADKARYPVLLSNGNLTHSGDLDGGRHFATWHDPFPKPSYLFALVAGDLLRREASFTTRSGREVPIHIYVEARNKDLCAHALESVKKSMAWDERVYGREYDLDVFMIVAVDDFNMGAMENKGLNIFNSKYVLARTDTATDEDFENVSGVIGHEYFHNWSGNRVTCRDWFQLSLKEGFTVFRDQQFTADMTSAPIKRIKDVAVLRSAQFREDAGPLAHSVRPDSYVEINNFYTLTVYNKGAEVVRMEHTLLGAEAFRKGTDLYFDRHDGQAATVDNFVDALQEASGRDLSQFMRWYSQAGTPLIEVTGHHDATAKTYTLHMKQSCPPTPGQPEKEPFLIPVAMALLDNEGHDLSLRMQGEPEAQPAGTRVLELSQTEQSFVFVDVHSPPVPSLLRNFSAPVHLRFAYSGDELAFLASHDSDPFNRWEAGQRLAQRVILQVYDKLLGGQADDLDRRLAGVMRRTLEDNELDRRLIAQALILPAESYLAEQTEEADPVAIHRAREFVRVGLAKDLRPQLEAVWQANRSHDPYQADADSIGKRRLANVCLSYLVASGDDAMIQRADSQLREADNMTDSLAALSGLADLDDPRRDQALQWFYDTWKSQPLVVDKWLLVQAMSRRSQALDDVVALTQHQAFDQKVPNKVYALIRGFAGGNPAAFHAADGSGYRFLADQVLTIDSFNPQIAARLLAPLSTWQSFDQKRQELMQVELRRIVAAPELSRNAREIVEKSLGAD